jgi:hypothetical protein
MKQYLTLAVLAFSLPMWAQSTVATGDSRTVTEPIFPSICARVNATKYIKQTTAVNIDPWNSTCGSTGGTFGILWCTGGTDYQPSSSSSSYVSAETLDNTAVQNALNSCPSGQGVELIPGTSGQNAFVLAPFSIVNSSGAGVNLIVDAGIHVFASRNLSDYGGTNCGLTTNSTSDCNHWITSPSTTGAGIYGYGVLDGRGWSAYIGQTTHGFYANRILAYCDAHGGAIAGSPGCPNTTSGVNSYGPNGINLIGTTNFTMYKISLWNSGNFLINWQSGNGFTAWDVKLIAPFEVSNTDGWDPLNSTNGTFTHSFISVGDNHMAVKATSGASSNITFSNSQTGAGIGVAIGTNATNGISNVLVDTLVQNGNLYSTQSAGIMIGSSTADGGLVNKVTYRNVCMVNEYNSIRLYTNYGGNTGSNIPVYQNILLRNITVLPSTAPYTTGNSGRYTFQGLSGHPIIAQIDNLHILGTNQGVAAQSGVTTDQYSAIYLGPGTVDSTLLTQFSGGTGVTTSGSTTSTTQYACTSTTWQPLIGELNIKTSVSNNNQTATVIALAPFTLQAVLQPSTAISTKESPALTASVNFYDNCFTTPTSCSPIGTVALSGDGTYAAYTLSSGTSLGTHNYIAYYPGDSNYPAYTFGSVTVTAVTAPPAAKSYAPIVIGELVTPAGFEPATLCLEGRCSIH